MANFPNWRKALSLVGRSSLGLRNRSTKGNGDGFQGQHSQAVPSCIIFPNFLLNQDQFGLALIRQGNEDRIDLDLIRTGDADRFSLESDHMGI